MYVGVALANAPLKTSLTLMDAGSDAGAAHRLASLGLRVGSQFSLLSRTAGGGRVLLVAGSRVAIGKELLHGLRAEVNA